MNDNIINNVENTNEQRYDETPLTTTNIPTMLTINETAKITNLAKHYIRSLVWDNKIVYIQAGNKYLINLDKLIQFLNGEDIMGGN